MFATGLAILCHAMGTSKACKALAAPPGFSDTLQDHELLNGRVTEDRLQDILHSLAQQPGGAEQTPAAGLAPAGGGPTPAGGSGSHPVQRALLETWMLREYCDMGSLQVRLCLVCALATGSTATSMQVGTC